MPPSTGVLNQRVSFAAEATQQRQRAKPRTTWQQLLTAAGTIIWSPTGVPQESIKNAVQIALDAVLLASPP